MNLSVSSVSIHLIDMHVTSFVWKPSKSSEIKFIGLGQTAITHRRLDSQDWLPKEIGTSPSVGIKQHTAVGLYPAKIVKRKKPVLTF